MVFLVGHFGVGLFFSLSGYLIVRSLDFNKDSAYHFFLKRFCKIVPVYVFLSLVFFTVSKIEAFGVNSNFAFIDLVYSVLFLSQILSDNLPVLYVGWSLEYEVLFYISIYILLLSDVHNIRRQILNLLSLVFFAAFDSSYAYFIIGLLLYKLQVMLAEFRSCNKFEFYVAIVILLVSLILMRDFYILSFIFLTSLVQIRTNIGLNPKMHRLMSILARSTYSIYLLQVFRIPVVLRASVFAGFELSFYLILIITIILNSLAGVLCFMFVEKPLEKKLLARFL
jgi:exopolysaccharide production protein ExoZ